MNAPFVVAQAVSVPNAATAPKIIKVTRPADGQAITIQMDGSVKLDLTAISSEKITLVRVGERLTILFENKSTVTIDPFFDSSGRPLQISGIELQSDRIVSAEELASIFPITDDQSVLPAAGEQGASAQNTGSAFGGPAVDPLASVNPLDLLPQEELGTWVSQVETGPLVDDQAATPDEVPVQTGARLRFVVEEEHAIPQSEGEMPARIIVNSGGNEDPHDGSQPGSSGANPDGYDRDTPDNNDNTTREFHGTGATALTALITGGTPPLSFIVFDRTGETARTETGTAVTSEGVPIVYGNYNTSVPGQTSIDGMADGVRVFTLTIEANGDWTFTLYGKLDHPIATNDDGTIPQGVLEDVLGIDLTRLVLAIDDNGSQLALSGTGYFVVDVIDDTPTLTVTNPTVTNGFDFGEFVLNGNQWGQGSGVDSTSPSGAWQFGSTDGGPGSVQLERVGDGYLGMHSSTGGYMVDMDATANSLTLSQTLNLVSGETYQLSFEAGSPIAGTAHLQVYFGGQLVFDLDPTVGSMNTYVVQLTGGLGNGSNLLEFRETGPDDNHGTYLANVRFVDLIVDESAGVDANSNDSADPALAALYGAVQNKGVDGDMPAPEFAKGLNSVVDVTVSFGADGPNQTNALDFSLKLVSEGVDSGLRTTEGQAIFLYTEGDFVVGRFDDNGTQSAAFALHVDGSGVLSVGQFVSLYHPNANSADEGVYLKDDILSVTVTARDGDNDTITKSADISDLIRFEDDGPRMADAAGISGEVDEDALNNPAIDGNEDGLRAGETTGTGSVLFTGAANSLNSLVDFGSDGAGATPFQFVSVAAAREYLIGQNLTSADFLINDITINGNQLTAQSSDGRDIFKLTINDNGSWSFELLDKIDHPVTLNPDAPNNGAYEDTISVSLGGFVDAYDGDGDHANMGNAGFSVTIRDDIPFTPGAAASLIANGAFTQGNWSSPEAWWGAAATNADSWTISGGSNFERVPNGFLNMTTSNGASMIDMAGSPGNLTISQNITGMQAGQTYAIQFEAGAPFPDTAKLEVLWNGQVIGTIEPSGPGALTSYNFIVTGAGVPSLDQLTFREVGTGDAPIPGNWNGHGLQNEGYHGTYIANIKAVPVYVVDEDGLADGNGDTALGDAATNSASVTGVLGISWGADNHNGGADTVGADGHFTQDTSGRSVVFANASVGISGGTLTSHGDAITITLSADGTRLIGTAGAGEGSRTVFEVTLSDDDSGKFNFVLKDQLDHAPGASENDITLTFTYTATDSDGDQATGTFLVGVDDDMPAVVAEGIKLTVDEDDIRTPWSQGTSPNTSPEFPGDQSTTENNVGLVDPAKVSGSVASLLVGGGADEHITYGFTDQAIAYMQSLQLFSKQSANPENGVALSYSISTSGNFVILSAYEPDVVGDGVNGSNPVFEFRLNTTTGQFEFRLFDELIHMPGDGENTALRSGGPGFYDLDNDGVYEANEYVASGATVPLSAIDFGKIISATDYDGDTVTFDGKLLIEIKDDVPDAGIRVTGRDVQVDESGGNDSFGDNNTHSGGVKALFAGLEGTGQTGNDPDVPGDNNGPTFGVGAIAYAHSGWAVVSNSSDVGADHPPLARVFSLSVVDGAYSGLKTTEGQNIYLYMGTGAAAGLVLGRVGNDSDAVADSPNASGTVAFAIAIEQDGDVALAQYLSIKHDNTGSHDESATLVNGAIKAVLTVTDSDGDTDTASADIGSHIVFEDDGPRIEKLKLERFVTVSHDETPGVQGDADDVASALAIFNGIVSPKGNDPHVADADKIGGAIGFAKESGLIDYSVDFGADGAAAQNSAVFSLQLKGGNGIDSGLDTTEGNSIRLYVENGIIVGKVDGGPNNGSVAFAIAIDATTGEVSLVQYLSIEHGNTSSHDESAGLSLGYNKAIEVKLTVTDGDGDTDTRTVDITGAIKFQDDGPALLANDNNTVKRDWTLDDDRQANGNDLFDNPADTNDYTAITDAPLGVVWGSDGPGGLLFTTVQGQPNFVIKDHNGAQIAGPLTSGGVALVYQIVTNSDGGQTLTAYRGSIDAANKVFAITLDPDGSPTGDFSVEFFKAIDHPAGNGDSPLQLEVGFIAKDGDGDAATSSITIRIVDDVPVAGYAGRTTLTEDAQADGTFIPQTGTGTMTFQGGADGAKITSLNYDITYGGGAGIADGDAASWTTYPLTSGGQPITVSQTAGANGPMLVGKLGDGTVIFEIEVTNPSTGAYTVTLKGPIDHPDTNEVGADDPLRMRVSFTVTDGDGDTATGRVQIDIRDDGPNAAITAGEGTLVVDETAGIDAGSDDVAGPLFTLPAGAGTPIQWASASGILQAGGSQFGADGPGTSTFSLTLSGANGVDSGLDTNNDRNIYLFAENGQIVGREAGAGNAADPAGAIAFVVGVDAATGNISIAQILAIKHDDPTDADESSPNPGTIAQAISNGVLYGTVTVTDADGDTSVANVDIGGKIIFEDDGPKIIELFQDYGPELIVNGSFEGSGVGNNDWDIFHGIPGWTSNGTIPFEIQTGNVAGIGPQDGNSYVELDSDTQGNPAHLPAPGVVDPAGGTNATIQQTVVGVQAGQNYELSFYYSSRDGGGANSSGLKVFFGGEEVYDIEPDQTVAGWQKITIQINAPVDNAVLAFVGTGGANELGALLDNVTLRKVYNTLDDEDTTRDPAVEIQGGPGDDGHGVTATGKISFDAGADGLKSIVIAGIPNLKAIWVDAQGVGHQESVQYQAWAPDGQGGGTLTAYSANLPEVFTITVDKDGNYAFTLKAPLAHPDQGEPVNYENNLPLNFDVTITDGDGDTATTVLSFDVDDDSPEITGAPVTPSTANLLLNGNFTAADDFGANDQDSWGQPWGGFDPNGITGWTVGWSPVGGGSGEPRIERMGDSYLGMDTGLNLPMIDMAATPGNLEISQTVTTVAGATYAISFMAGAPYPGSAELVVLWNGVEVLRLDPPPAEMTNYTIPVLATGTSGVLTFQEVGSMDGNSSADGIGYNHGTYLANVSLTLGGHVLDDEDTTQDPAVEIAGGPGDDGAGVTATGKLSFNAGADGVGSIVFGSDITSVKAIFVDSAGIGHQETITTSWVANGAGGTLYGFTTHFNTPDNPAYKLVVQPDGSYVFTLYAPLAHEDQNNNFENNLVLNLGFTIFDGDGDQVASKLTINIDDDTPVFSGDGIENGVVTALNTPVTHDLNLAFGADGQNAVDGLKITGWADLDGVTETLSADGKTLTATIDGGNPPQVLYSLTLNDNGTYTFTQGSNLPGGISELPTVNFGGGFAPTASKDYAGFTLFGLGGGLLNGSNGVGINDANMNGGDQFRIVFDNEMTSADLGVDFSGNGTLKLHWIARDENGVQIASGDTANFNADGTIPVTPGVSFHQLDLQVIVVSGPSNPAPKFKLTSIGGETETTTPLGDLTFQVTGTDGDGDSASDTFTISTKSAPPLAVQGTFNGVVEEEQMVAGSGTPFPTLATGNEDTQDQSNLDTDEGSPQVLQSATGSFAVSGGDGSYVYNFASGIEGTNVLKVGGGNLTSEGAPVKYHVYSSDTLIGYVDSGSEGYSTGERVVFSLVMQPNGTWAFTLYDNVDHPVATSGGAAGEEAIAINLDGKVIVDDQSGQTAALNGSITIIDDVPVITAAADTVSVNEGNLPSDRNPVVSFPAGVAQAVTGFLHISWGADGGDAKHLAFAKDVGGNPVGPNLTSDGVPLLYVVRNPGDSAGNEQIVAYKQGSDPDTNPVFSITLYEQGGGYYTYVQYQNIDHSGIGADATTLNFDIQAFDSDGDSVQQTLTVKVTDDTPVVSAGNAAVVHDETVGDDGNDDTTDPLPGDFSTRMTALTAQLAGAEIGHARGGAGEVTFTAGADGLKNVALTDANGQLLSGVDSGLDRTGGSSIFLYADGTNDNIILGREGANDTTANPNGKIIFAVYLDQGTGEVWVVQYGAIEHDVPGSSHDEAKSITDKIHVTVTDGDNDATTSTGAVTVTFEDDGPTLANVVANGSVTLDETNAVPSGFPISATSASAILTDTHSFGTDGAAAGGGVTYAITVTDAASGLKTAIGDFPITLHQTNATTITGQYTDGVVKTAFTVAINADGTLTVTQNVPLEHLVDGDNTLGEHNDTLGLAGKIAASVTITDGDNDTATDGADIGGLISFYDDGPSLTTAITGAATINEGSSTSGTWSAAPGADGLQSIAFAITGGASQTVGTASFGDVVFNNVQGGTLTFHQDGTWTYQSAANSITSDKSFAFTVTVTDNDGDTRSDSETVNITNTNPLPTTTLTTAHVDDEGLAGGIAGDGQSSGDDTIANVDGDNNEATYSGTLSFNLNGGTLAAGPDPINFAGMNGASGTIGTEAVTWSWNSTTDTLTATSARGPVMQVELNTSTGQYEVALLKPVLHALGDGENNTTVNLTYNLNTTSGSTTGTLAVSVDDDTPVVNDAIATAIAGVKPSVNIVLVIDTSGSMGSGQGSRMEIAKAAAINLLNNSDVVFNQIMVVDFDSTASFNTQSGSAWTDKNDAIQYIQDLSANGGTNYDAALDAVMDNWGTGPTPATQTLVYFISDGQPTTSMSNPGFNNGGSSYDPSLGDGIGEETANHADPDADLEISRTEWEQFLAAKGVHTAYAIGVESVAEAHLEPISWTATDANLAPVVIAGAAELSVLLSGSLPGNPAGNIFDNGGGFGADGGYVKSIVVNGTEYTYNGGATGKQVSIITANGGKIVFNFADNGLNHAGDWEYFSPTNVAGTPTETVTYTVVDGDGDQQSGSLAINILQPPSIAVSAGSASEDAGYMQFTVSLSHTTLAAVPVTFSTAAGTAAAGTDYGSAVEWFNGSSWVSTPFSFAAGQTSVQVRVAVTDDTLDEANETFTLTATAGSGTSNGTANNTGTIIDNDAPVTFSVSDASAQEGVNGTITFTVTKSAVSGLTSTVEYSVTAGTADSPNDYTGTLTGTLTFGPNETTKTITLNVVNDGFQGEPNETFTVTLGNPTNAAVADGTGVGTIIDAVPAAPKIALDSTHNVRDEFSNAAYNNNNGSKLWNGSWTEGSDDNSVSGGDIRIVSGQLRFGDDSNGQDGGEAYISRMVNLDGALSAKLSFTVQQSGPGADEDLFIQVFNGSTNEWQTVQTILGSDPNGTYNFTGANAITLTAAQIGSFSGIRFRMNNDLESSEFYYIDNVTIDYVLPTGNHTASFTENGAAVAIASADTLITDADSTTMASASIVLTNKQAGDQLLIGGVVASGSGTYGGINYTVTDNGSQIALALAGLASVAAYEAFIEAVTFQNTSENPSELDRIIQVSVHDGYAASNVATSTIEVHAVNDPVTVSGLTVTSSGISFTAHDVDDATVSLTSPAGNSTITTGAVVNHNVTAGSVANGMITVSDGDSSADVVHLYRGSNSGNTIDASSNTKSSAIYGFGDNDTLTGGSAADWIFGGDGDDTINGAQNDYILDGGNGTDTLYVAGGFTSSSNDQIVNIENVTLSSAGTLNLSNQTEGFDITGSSGDDILIGGSGSDTFVGGSGNDVIHWNIGDGSVDGGANSSNNLLTSGNRGDVLVVKGVVDFTSIGDIFSNIETISMRDSENGTGNENITLHINDVLQMADTGRADPGDNIPGSNYDNNPTLRIDGDAGDVLNLANDSGTWMAASGATGIPSGYNAYVHVASGSTPSANEDAYLFVATGITVNGLNT